MSGAIGLIDDFISEIKSSPEFMDAICGILRSLESARGLASIKR